MARAPSAYFQFWSHFDNRAATWRDGGPLAPLSEVIELSTAHARKQFEALSAQSRELATLAQKVATEAAEPIKEGMTRAAKKVA